MWREKKRRTEKKRVYFFFGTMIKKRSITMCVKKKKSNVKICENYHVVCKNLTLCGFESLINGTRCSDSRSVNSPIEKQHHKHWYIK